MGSDLRRRRDSRMAGTRLCAAAVAMLVLTSACGHAEPAPVTSTDLAVLCPEIAPQVESLRHPPLARTKTILVYVIDRALVPGWDSYPPWPILPTTAFDEASDISSQYPFEPDDVVLGFYKSSRSSAQDEIFLKATLSDDRPGLDPLPTLLPTPGPTSPLVRGGGQATPSPAPGYCDSLQAWVTRERQMIEDDAAGQLIAFRAAQRTAFQEQRR